MCGKIQLKREEEEEVLTLFFQKKEGRSESDLLPSWFGGKAGGFVWFRIDQGKGRESSEVGSSEKLFELTGLGGPFGRVDFGKGIRVSDRSESTKVEIVSVCRVFT